MDGSVIADVNGERQFEPASAIKIVAAVTALLAARPAPCSLTTPSPTTTIRLIRPSNPEHQVTPTATRIRRTTRCLQSLQYAIQQMLQVSDNRMTLAIEHRLALPSLIQLRSRSA